jgi:MinD superfamily P-loop ATPase
VKIAIASGKGGTGKTTLAVNLAVALAGEGAVGLLDCDVEEPNCSLYLKPPFDAIQPVYTLVPAIDNETCTGCGLCAGACEFNALVALPGSPMLLPEMCHACGVCAFVCPEEAISETQREIGVIGTGEVGGIYLRWGSLHVGEARAAPVIRAVKDTGVAALPDTVFIDAPPGVACPAVEALRAVDFAVLVTEPTPFGLHDLKLAVETARELNLHFGVVVNRVGIGDSRVESFCASEDIDILMEIPDNRRIAEACSRGEVFAATDETFASELRGLAQDLSSRIENLRPRELTKVAEGISSHAPTDGEGVMRA